MSAYNQVKVGVARLGNLDGVIVPLTECFEGLFVGECVLAVTEIIWVAPIRLFVIAGPAGNGQSLDGLCAKRGHHHHRVFTHANCLRVVGFVNIG